MTGVPERSVPEPADAAEDAEVRRLVHLALAGTALGVLVGTAVVVAAVIGVVTLRGRPGAGPDLGSPAGVLLVGGTFGGMVAAAASTWLVLRPLGNWFRRGMLGTVSAFATAVVMLLAIPAHALLGLGGLAGLLAVCLLGALLLWRRAARLAA